MTDDKTNDTEETKTEVAEETAAPEVVEEAKVDATPEPKAEEKAEKPAKSTSDLSPALAKIAKEIEGLTAPELSQLAGHLEDVFGVSAMPMMATAPAAGGAAAAEPAEEKSNFDVVLASAGDNKLGVIKAVREVKPDLGLMDAKKLVETAPQTVLAGAKKDDAEAAKAKLEAAGAKVELK